MKILVIGGGGREHALVWKLAQSPRVEKIWCAPGNAGIAQEAECVATDAGDVQGIVELAAKLGPDLTVVGPELPLINGIADAFAAKGWPIVAPSREAAQLEGSKIFAKQFLQRHSIATPKMLGTYESSREAIAALDSRFVAARHQSGRPLRRQGSADRSRSRRRGGVSGRRSRSQRTRVRRAKSHVRAGHRG